MKNNLILLLFISNLFSATDNIGENLPFISILPFIGILFSIAVIPLFKPKFWHDNFGKVSAFWTVLFIIPFTFYFGIKVSVYNLLHVLLFSPTRLFMKKK